MLKQDYLFEPIPCDKFDLLNKEEVVELYKGTRDLLEQALRYSKKLEGELVKSEQKRFSLGEKFINIKHRLFGKSSEKSKTKKQTSGEGNKPPKKKRVLLPSERYPDVEIIEKDVELENPPHCGHCRSKMVDSGMTEDSEYLTVIPKRHYIVRQKRHKYCCPCCHGLIETAPAIPRIKPGGSYSDEMAIDVALSKYLELMPIERYVMAAKRQGVDLKANSLYQLTHYIADFMEWVHHRAREKALSDEIVYGDETPHRMLEGDKRSNWFLWGFSSKKACYFEVRDTRSGSVAGDLLKESNCRYLMSDVFSGYQRAINDANEGREKPILSLFCNSHSRRKFKESEKNFVDSKFFLRAYRRIYKLEGTKNKAIKEQRPYYKKTRVWQKIYMQAMFLKAQQLYSEVLPKSSLGNGLSYFIKNYVGLSRFTTRDDLPLDNNSQERLLRPHVVGRKTWYGTHSKRGAKTAAILFTIVESCKLNNVNPREYFRDFIKAVHEKRPLFAPWEYNPSPDTS